MPNKPIIDIDVNDEQFKKFYELYKEYQGDLEKMPDAWKKIGAATTQSHEAAAAIAGAFVESMSEAVGHAKDLSRYLKLATEAQKQFGSATHHGESALKKMAKEAKEVGESIFGIGKYLFKLGAMGVGAFAGGLFGIDRLAVSSVGNERSARGLGMSTGQFRAFDTDMGRYVNQSTLGSIANAQNDYVGRVWLQRASGLTQSQVMATNAGDLASRIAIRAHNWWNSTPAAQHTEANLQATGFLQSGLTMEDMRRLGNSSLQELQKGRSDYLRDSATLDYRKGSTDALFDFSRNVKLAGQQLQTAFSDKLSQLNKSGALSKFIANLEKDGEKLINGVLTPKNLDAVEKGMTSLASYLGSDNFHKTLSGFVTAIQDVTNAVLWAANLIHPGENTSNDALKKPGALQSGGIGKWAAQHAKAILDGKSSLASKDSVVFSALKNLAYANGWDPVTGKAVADELSPSGASVSLGGYHNPGNLRSAKGFPTVKGFAKFGSDAQGYAAMASLLKRYPKLYNASSIDSIIRTYAPASENDDATYIANVSKWTGFGAKQQLDLNNPEVLSKLMAAMVRQENGITITPQQVQDQVAKGQGGNLSSADLTRTLAALSSRRGTAVNITITNKAGANVAVSANSGGI